MIFVLAWFLFEGSFVDRQEPLLWVTLWHPHSQLRGCALKRCWVGTLMVSKLVKPPVLSLLLSHSGNYTIHLLGQL